MINKVDPSIAYGSRLGPFKLAVVCGADECCRTCPGRVICLTLNSLEVCVSWTRLLLEIGPLSEMVVKSSEATLGVGGCLRSECHEHVKYGVRPGPDLDVHPGMTACSN